MTTPTTITIDSIRYVREDSIVPAKLGDKRIIIADRGWVFVGDCTDESDGTVTIRNAKNIRKWGTTTGLGQLVNGPTGNTVADEYGTVKCLPIAQISVVGGW
jgi:hypothetical protein